METRGEGRDGDGEKFLPTTGIENGETLGVTGRKRGEHSHGGCHT
ncbi:uncharacterized protein G2W53_042485 [Senna tora]|uniref:Uncharacterized protein n=1 Tax=Senna tora TaxID=362788 RepID=A0A834W3Y6_9FABA|nr:uncharacterized protein G2W53_042485 [Senna tora]